MAFDRIPPPETVIAGDKAVYRDRHEFLLLWKRRWSRRLRMRVTDQDIATLLGLTAGTINRKINGKINVSKRMRPALTNIDIAIETNRLPCDCPDGLARGILSYQINRPSIGGKNLQPDRRKA